jgi:hypothetical protein
MYGPFLAVGTRKAGTTPECTGMTKLVFQCIPVFQIPQSVPTRLFLPGSPGVLSRLLAKEIVVWSDL